MDENFIVVWPGAGQLVCFVRIAHAFFNPQPQVRRLNQQAASRLVPRHVKTDERETALLLLRT